jgi:hypothetical protein
VIRERAVLIVSARSASVIVEALLNPPKPNDAALAGAGRFRREVGSFRKAAVCRESLVLRATPLPQDDKSRSRFLAGLGARFGMTSLISIGFINLHQVHQVSISFINFRQVHQFPSG